MGKAVFLVIEPSPILRPVLNRWLGNILPYSRLLVAANGAEALQLATQEIPSYVLMEVNLPDRKGLETLHQLRQGLPAARIIATGWYESPWFLDRVRSAGADGFILKDKLARELLPLWEISIE